MPTGLTRALLTQTRDSMRSSSPCGCLLASSHATVSEMLEPPRLGVQHADRHPHRAARPDCQAELPAAMPQGAVPAAPATSRHSRLGHKTASHLSQASAMQQQAPGAPQSPKWSCTGLSQHSLSQHTSLLLPFTDSQSSLRGVLQPVLLMHR